MRSMPTGPPSSNASCPPTSQTCAEHRHRSSSASSPTPASLSRRRARAAPRACSHLRSKKTSTEKTVCSNQSKDREMPTGCRLLLKTRRRSCETPKSRSSRRTTKRSIRSPLRRRPSFPAPRLLSALRRFPGRRRSRRSAPRSTAISIATRLFVQTASRRQLCRGQRRRSSSGVGSSKPPPTRRAQPRASVSRPSGNGARPGRSPASSARSTQMALHHHCRVTEPTSPSSQAIRLRDPACAVLRRTRRLQRARYALVQARFFRTTTAAVCVVLSRSGSARH